MTTTDRDSIIRNTTIHHLLRRFCAGVGVIKNTPAMCLLLFALVLFEAVVWAFHESLFGLHDLGAFEQSADGLVRFVLMLLFGFSIPITLVLLGTPWGSKRVRLNLQKVGIVNDAGEAPLLVSKRQDANHPRMTVWEFDPCGLPLSIWEDKQERIEAALNIIITTASWGEGRKTVCIYAVPAMADLPALFQWRDEYLRTKSFELVLGESLMGPVMVDLCKIPHILLGGSTGSGKSVLLKLLLMQALRKGAMVWIADFKGGVDYPQNWSGLCEMVFNEADLLETLDKLVWMMEQRKAAFRFEGCANLDEYNQKVGCCIPRCIFACDEVAELLDKTGADGERKKLLAQIESKLSTIARQGRAFGIHLIFATQRPDANVIPGQIKNNMDFRVCGKADNVLSQIILDNTSAAERIPKDSQGRFITADGTVFQAYLFDEKQI